MNKIQLLSYQILHKPILGLPWPISFYGQRLFKKIFWDTRHREILEWETLLGSQGLDIHLPDDIADEEDLERKKTLIEGWFHHAEEQALNRKTAWLAGTLIGTTIIILWASLASS